MRLVVDAPGLLFNDFDPDGDQLVSGFLSDPSNGRVLAMTQDGAFTYEPERLFDAAADEYRLSTT